MTFYLIWPVSRNNRSVKFWSAFLMDLEKQLVANINVLNENIPDYDTLKFKGFLIKYLCSVVVWSVISKKRDFLQFFYWRQHFRINRHEWLAYLLRNSHAKFQACSFKGKSIMVFLVILVLSGENSGLEISDLYFWHLQEKFLWQTLFFRKYIWYPSCLRGYKFSTWYARLTSLLLPYGMQECRGHGTQES